MIGPRFVQIAVASVSNEEGDGVFEDIVALDDAGRAWLINPHDHRYDHWEALPHHPKCVCDECSAARTTVSVGAVMDSGPEPVAFPEEFARKVKQIQKYGVDGDGTYYTINTSLPVCPRCGAVPGSIPALDRWDHRCEKCESIYKVERCGGFTTLLYLAQNRPHDTPKP